MADRICLDLEELVSSLTNVDEGQAFCPACSEIVTLDSGKHCRETDTYAVVQCRRGSTVRVIRGRLIK